MKILVLGCRGQLGSDCMKVLAKAGIDAIGMDFPDVDITSSTSLAAALDSATPDIAVNCAAYTAVDKAESDCAACRILNAAAPWIIGKECAKRNVKIIHISTDYVFDGEREPPDAYLEGDTTRPQSVYGRTKLEGEESLASSGAEYSILRTAWLYGANGKNFPKTMLRLAMSSKTPSVVADQWGSPTWSYRLAEQILAVATARNFPKGIHHATSEGYTNWYDFAQTFLSMMEVPVTITPCTTADYPTPAKRPHCSILENKTLKDAGLNVMRDWKEDLREFTALFGDALLAETAAQLSK